MKVEALALAIALAGCGKSDKKQEPAEAPSLSSDGSHKVPPGYETSFKFGDRDVKLEYTWVAISMVGGGPAFTIEARGAGMGQFQMKAPIPEHTPSFSSMAGGSFNSFANEPSFGLTADMAMGRGAAIKITEVTATSMSGEFTTQACKDMKPTCDRPIDVKGTFKAYRSPLSDDAMFERIYVRKGQ